MKTKITFLLLLTLIPHWAFGLTLNWGSNPSSANSGQSYTYSAIGEGEAILYVALYKNGIYVSGVSSGEASITTSDIGPTTIGYFAESESYYEEYRWLSSSITISAPVNTAPIGSFDWAAGSVTLGQALSANGWAADNEMGAPVSRVQMKIDGNDVGDATLGGSRSDVSSAYGRGDYQYSGWNFSFGTGGLAAGGHSIEAIAWDNQGSSTYLGSRGFSVTNHAPTNQLTSPGVQTIILGTALTLTAQATDGDGNITTHNLDIQRPDASWNWQGGFAYGEPYMGGPVGSGASSTRSASFTFNQVGLWRVRSWVCDANGNNTHSATVEITVNPPPDTQAPTVPVNPAASALGSSSFTLSWSASTDNVGVTGYEVKRDTTPLGTVGATSMSITGLAPSTTYAMNVRARDAANNWSAWGTTLNVTTALPAPAITSPTTWAVPQNAQVNPYQITATQSPTSYGLTGSLPAGLVFTAATGRISGSTTASGVFPVTTSATGASGTGSQSLSITVVANGLVPNATLSTPGTGTVLAGRLYVKPNDVVTLQPGGSADATLGIGWTENNVFRPDTTVRLYPNQVSPNHFNALTYTPDGGPGAYFYKMSLVDIGQDGIDQDVPFTVDAVAPTAPTGLGVSSVTSTSLTFSWTASTDNNNVTAYEVLKGSVSQGTTTSTSWNFTGLTPGAANSFTVRARDAAGNWSPAVGLALGAPTISLTAQGLTATGGEALSAADSTNANMSFTVTGADADGNFQSMTIWDVVVSNSSSGTTTGITDFPAGLAANTTLGSLALQTNVPGWVGSSTAQRATADQIWFWGGASWLVFYFDTDFGYWRLITDVPASPNRNTFGSAIARRFQLRRLAGRAPVNDPVLFSWLFPATTSASLSLAFQAGGGTGVYSLAAVSRDTNGNTSGVASVTWQYSADTDGDGVPDSIEAQLGTNPSVAKQNDANNNTQLKIIKPN